MPERRFSEAEVAAIFQRATEAPTPQRSALVSSEGMSLAQLQEIGREVGIAPEAVAHAAQTLNDTGAPTDRRFIGFPIGVGRSVELDRKISEQEWEQIVVDLRQTFDARGRLKQEGGFRQWTNGNLQALLEPTPTGTRLRLKTYNANARAFMVAGLVFAGFGAAPLIATIAAGVTDIRWTSMVEMGVIGAALFAFGSLRLPGWARLRQRQMGEVFTRVATDTPRAPTDIDNP
ncbi:MAG: hypothetical protein ABIR92_09895 [Gemmatimonadaceae bacterium]